MKPWYIGLLSAQITAIALYQKQMTNTFGAVKTLLYFAVCLSASTLHVCWLASRPPDHKRYHFTNAAPSTMADNALNTCRHSLLTGRYQNLLFFPYEVILKMMIDYDTG